jgi:hypothetical protein
VLDYINNLQWDKYLNQNQVKYSSLIPSPK